MYQRHVDNDRNSDSLLKRERHSQECQGLKAWPGPRFQRSWVLSLTPLGLFTQHRPPPPSILPPQLLFLCQGLLLCSPSGLGFPLFPPTGFFSYANLGVFLQPCSGHILKTVTFVLLVNSEGKMDEDKPGRAGFQKPTVHSFLLCGQGPTA